MPSCQGVALSGDGNFSEGYTLIKRAVSGWALLNY